MTEDFKTARSPGGVFAVSCHEPAAEAEQRQAAGGCERSDTEPKEKRAQNPFTLTDAEREAVEWFAEVPKPLSRLAKSNGREHYIDTLRGLLERLGGKP